MAEEMRYERARARVRQLREFYVHLGLFIVVNIGLAIVDLASGDGTWFYWSLIGWGFGLAWHAYEVFGPENRFGRAWEERKIRELMEQERRQDEV